MEIHTGESMLQLKYWIKSNLNKKDREINLVVVVLGFSSHQQQRSYGDGSSVWRINLNRSLISGFSTDFCKRLIT